MAWVGCRGNEHLLVAAAGVMSICMWKHQSLMTFFSGQSSITMALIANNAAQGILSSFFYKARLPGRVARVATVQW